MRHELIDGTDLPGVFWVLECDDQSLTLTDPDGVHRLAIDAISAPRLIALRPLYYEGALEVTHPGRDGSLQFLKHRAAAAELRSLVAAGLRIDTPFLVHLRREAVREVLVGVPLTLVCGGLFSLYCWWAITQGDPPPGTWQRWLLVNLGPFISAVLMLLLAFTLVGPMLSFYGLRQSWRFWRISRSVMSVD